MSAFRPFLPRPLQAKVAGTVVVDPSTMTPGQVRERAEDVIANYEREEERRLVAATLDKVGAGGFAAAGVDWCLAATNEHAVQLLLVHDDERVPGRVCDSCGWLGLDGDECPLDGQQTRTTADVIDEMAAAVIDTSGSVEHVEAATDLARHVVAADLRFPVPRDHAAT
jgi:peptide chain release factor subunit 1